MKPLKAIQIFDIISALIVLLALFLIPYGKIYWLLYSLGCCFYMIVMYKKKLWGGILLNIVAAIIGIINFISFSIQSYIISSNIKASPFTAYILR